MSLRKTSRFALGIIIPMLIISAYLILQISTVAAYNNFCRNVVLSTHLTDIKFLDTSPETLLKGMFTASFTFSNPQNQPVSITSMSAVLFPTSLGAFPLALGQGSIREPITLSNGETQVILQMNLTENATLATPSYWDIDYALKFGSVYYSSTVSTQPIQGLPPLRTYGSYSAAEDTALTQANTYTLLTIDTWAIGLETIAVFILLQERIINKTMHEKEASSGHTKMAAIIYILQGVAMLILPQLALFLQNSVIHHPPPEFAYGGHGVAGILADFLTIAYNVAALILLAISLGLLLRIQVAKSVAYYLSWIITTVGFILSVSFFAQLFWSTASAAQNLALDTLILAITFANILVVITLSPKMQPPKSDQNTTRESA